MPLDHLEKAMRKVINYPKVTRSQARLILKSLLRDHGWHIQDETQSPLGDVVAFLRSSQAYIIIKLWVHPRQDPVPKFYVEQFLRSIYKTLESCHVTPLFDKHHCLECEKFCLLSKRVYKYFLTNAPLEPDAYNYFRVNSKGTVLIRSDAAIQQVRAAQFEQTAKRSGTLDVFSPPGNKDLPATRTML